jgi:stress response protein YsnF
MAQKQPEKLKLHTLTKDQPYIKDSDLQIYEPSLGPNEESLYQVNDQDRQTLKMLHEKASEEERRVKS